MNRIIKNDLENESTNLTPIEIALGIDEEGRTTARKLYEFLELAKGQFSRWAKTNILENVFAIKNEDYEGFDINVEGNITTDYKLSASFAKKLAMGTHNKKGEAAKAYFIKVEDKLKEIAINSQSLNTSELSPELQMFKQIFDTVAKQQLENKQIKAEIKETKKEIQDIREVVTLNPNSWRTEVTNILNKIAIERGGTQETYRHIRNESYELLDARAGAKLSIRLTNIKRKVLEETGSKSKADKVSKLDVIAADKRLTEVYLAIVKDMAIKYLGREACK